jgi:rhamnose utilization protein RhaD (predicted bifunctional aldolase and dehydrogenase)/NAD(P)-dependent dehydrogenase (short-subunit alcohol dehydrogenase family)
MRNRWDSAEAGTHTSLLDSCAYASRLLGAESSLVLHGGGNSSIKQQDVDAFGDTVEALWVKGSGWNLADMTAEAFSPLKLDSIHRMLAVEAMSDTEMKRQLRAAMLDASAPNPSVEAMVHAAIPEVAVLHTHPDALLAISSTRDGASRIRSLYTDRVVVVRYARSGFRVGRATAIEVDKHLSAGKIGIVLMNHGLFTFGPTPETAYDRMIDLVSEAEVYIEEHGEDLSASDAVGAQPQVDRVDLAALRSAVSEVAGRPLIVTRNTDPESWAFSQNPNLESLASQGPATPDHVIWTKTLPMFGRDVKAYADSYEQFYEDHKHLATASEMLDPAPRVIFDDEFGMVTVGADVASADVASDIYLQTIKVIGAATRLGGYTALPHEDFFDLEYWELEQEKLLRAERGGEFRGEVALVTGSASGIGRACAAALLDRGAAVVGLDIDGSVSETFRCDAYLGVECDLTDGVGVSSALDGGVERFGGIDMVVAAAGLFPESSPIADHDPRAWRRAMSVNADAFAGLLAKVHPLLAMAPNGGRVVVIGSKNVRAPGPGASAYSASKAAANQLARVAALEWAAEGIRVNSVHPDAVFDTALWTDELLAERASRYGLTIDEYKRRNLMGIEVESADVAGVVAELLGDRFSRVTGAHIPVDGGNDRVI